MLVKPIVFICMPFLLCIVEIQSMDIFQALNQGYTSIADSLIKSNTFDPNQRDANDKPVIFAALDKGYTSIADSLIKKNGFDPNQRDASNKPVIFAALDKGYTFIADSLIKKNGFDPNQTDVKGKSVVSAALSKGYTSIAQTLTSHGNFDPNKTDASRKPIVFVAADKGYISAIESIMRNDNFNPHEEYDGKPIVLIAQVEGYANVVERLINDKRFDPNKQYGEVCNTLMHLAVAHNQPLLLQKLLKHPQCNLGILNNDNVSALQIFMTVFTQKTSDDIIVRAMPLLDVFVTSDKLNSLSEGDQSNKQALRLFLAYRQYREKIAHDYLTIEGIFFGTKGLSIVCLALFFGYFLSQISMIMHHV